MVELYAKKDHPTLETLEASWQLVESNISLEEVEIRAHHSFRFKDFSDGETVMYGGMAFFKSPKSPEVIRKCTDGTFQIWCPK